MRQLFRSVGLAAVLLVAGPALAADSNRIASIDVEEGPNNTVISIRGSATPTFTVFKLLDPVRILVDVAGGEIGAVTSAVQVRNGVVHDVETLQFASHGRRIGRIVIGFDQEAPYTVKADGNVIRVVIDGTDRSLPKFDAQKSKEALERARKVIEAEKALKQKLRDAQARAEKLEASQRASVSEQRRLQDDLTRLRTEMAELKAQLSAEKSGQSQSAELAAAAARKATERKKALEAATRLTTQKLAALKAEKSRLEAERDAARKAVKAAEARRDDLRRALAAEESRQKAAQRARKEEEALVAAARNARVAEEQRAAVAKRVAQTERERADSIKKLNAETATLRSRVQSADSRIADLEADLKAARKAGKAAAEVDRLEKALQTARDNHGAELARLQKARDAAEKRATDAASAHEAAQKELKIAKRSLKSQQAAHDAALARRAKAVARLEAQLKTRNAALARLEGSDSKRAKAEAEVKKLRAERLAAQRKAQDLAERSEALEARVAQLDKERKALTRAATAGKDVGAIQKLIEAKRTEVSELEGRLSKTQSERDRLGRDLDKQTAKIAETRRQLAREKEDLAAVLAQKKLFAKEIRDLKRQASTARKGYERVQKDVAKAESRLDELNRERKTEAERVAQLRREVASLERRRTTGGDARELEKALAAKEKEIANLRKAAAAASSQGDTQAAQLAKALAKARSEAASNEQAKKRLAQLEKFVARQKARLAGDNSALAAQQKELDAKERELADLRAQLKTLGTSDKKLVELKATLAKRESRLARLEADLAKAGAELTQERQAHRAVQGENRTLRSDLRAAERRLSTLEGQREKQTAQVASLQRKLDAARAKGGNDAKGLQKDLAAARSDLENTRRALNKAETSVGNLTAKLEAERAGRKAAVADLDAERARTDRLSKDLTAAKARIADLGDKQEAATAEVARLEGQLRAARTAGQDTSALASQLADAQSRSARLEKELAAERRQHEAERRSAEKRIAKLTGQRDKLEQRMADQQKRLGGLAKASTEAQRLQKRLDDSRAQVAELTRRLQSAKGDRAAADELAKALDDLETARQEAVAARKEATLAKAEAKDAKRRAATADQRVAEVDGKLRAANQRIDRLTLEKQRAADEVARLDKALATAKTAAKTGPKDDREAKRLARELSAARAELKRLQDAAAVAAAKPAPKPAPLTEKPAEKLARVTNVAFTESENVSRVEISLDGTVPYEIIERTDQRVVLSVSRARIPRALERRLDTSDFYGPIKLISSYTDPDDSSKVRIEVQLNDSVRNQLERRGNKLVWSFYNGQRVHMGRAVAGAQRDERPVTYRPTAVGGDRTWQPPGGGTAIPGGGTDFGVLSPYPKKRRTGRKYVGQKINLTIKDADIRQVLTFLAREGGVNIVANDQVGGTVTVHLTDVPWDLALEAILKAKGLDYVVEEGVYRVAPIDVIAAEFEKELEKRKKQAELKQLVVKLVSVNYAKASDLEGRVKDILSEKGTVSTDARTNTLIVKDVEEHVLAAEDLVRRLDTQTPQVLIEARIVEASSNFSEDVGIQWGGNYTASPAFGNETGLVFPAIVGISGAADDTTAPTTGLLTNQPRFAVNLPAAVGAGSGGGIGLTLGSLSGAGNLALRLTAAEERGTVKIISSPRVATLDNTEATISQGISIPISVVSSLGVNTQFFNAELSLKVLPTVTQDGNVNLKVDISKNEPNFSQTGANGNPTIERKEAQTQLLVRDGDTAVIGGIYSRNTSKSFKKVPGLGDIPFLGWLFKSRVQSDSRTELILFITPRIINRAASRVRVD